MSHLHMMDMARAVYLRLIDCVYHSNLGLRVVKKKKVSVKAMRSFCIRCHSSGPKVNCVSQVDF